MESPPKFRRFFAIGTLLLGACEEANGSAPSKDAGVGPSDAAQSQAACRARLAAEAEPGPSLWPADASMLRACDALAQDCGEGHKCTSIRLSFDAGWPAPACAPDNAGSRNGEGAICFGTQGMDTCGPGLACFNMGTGEGVCAKLCDPCSGGTSCGADSRCILVSSSPTFALCMPRCGEQVVCPADYAFECVSDPDGDYCDLKWRDGLH